MRPTQATLRDFIARHYTSQGQLRVTDILSGTTHDQISTNDPDDFADAHLVGPGTRTKGTTVFLNEDSTQLTSYFRSQIHPFDNQGTTSFIAIECQEQYALVPTDPMICLHEWLSDYGFVPLVERPSRLGQWVYWIFLNRREAQGQVREFLEQRIDECESAGVVGKMKISVPALAKEPRLLDVPCGFFGGDFFGRLHYLLGGTLVAAAPETIPLYDLRSGDMFVPDHYQDKDDRNLTDLVCHWGEKIGIRKVRAAVLVELARKCGVAIEALTNEHAPHAQAIALGHLLRSSIGNCIDGHTVNARPSGNSTVFWLSPNGDKRTGIR